METADVFLCFSPFYDISNTPLTKTRVDKLKTILENIKSLCVSSNREEASNLCQSHLWSSVPLLILEDSWGLTPSY